PRHKRQIPYTSTALPSFSCTFFLIRSFSPCYLLGGWVSMLFFRRDDCAGSLGGPRARGSSWHGGCGTGIRRALAVVRVCGQTRHPLASDCTWQPSLSPGVGTGRRANFA